VPSYRPGERAPALALQGLGLRRAHPTSPRPLPPDQTRGAAGQGRLAGGECQQVLHADSFSQPCQGPVPTQEKDTPPQTFLPSCQLSLNF